MAQQFFKPSVAIETTIKYQLWEEAILKITQIKNASSIGSEFAGGRYRYNGPELTPIELASHRSPQFEGFSFREITIFATYMNQIYFLVKNNSLR